MKSPIKDFSIEAYPKGSVTQFFGENPALYAKMGMSGHNGIDIVSSHGSPLFAVESGTVIDMRLDETGYGRHVRVLTKGIKCKEWSYGHCDTILVKVGDEVVEGQQIATMGNTGFVVSGATPYWKFNPFAGTHLHLGIREMKRSQLGWSYPGSTIKLACLNYNNGFKGSIDPRGLIEKISSNAAFEAKQLTIISLLTKVVELYKQLINLK